MTSIERRHVIGAAIGAALAAGATVAFASPPLAAATPAASSATASAKAGIVLAQAPSTGGSIGKSDKSIGGETAPPPASSPAPAARPAAREAPSPPPARKGGNGGGGGGNYDGTWSIVSVSPGCNSTSTMTIVLAGGRTVSPAGLSGQVNSDGSTSAVYHAENYTSFSSGRLSGRSGSGIFHTSTNCTGRWTAVKQ